LDRVYFYDGGGALVALPAEWTDAVPDDPFVVVAGGAPRSIWRDCSRCQSWSRRWRRPGGPAGGGPLASTSQPSS
jgi:hypothetical protein